MTFWTRIPEQVKRLSIMAVVMLALFFPVRIMLIPSDFGETGHYRASALDENSALDVVYAGHAVCFDCHDEIVETKSQGFHRNVACETCHGPAAAHAEDPDITKLRVPRERGYCPLCHEYLPSRPTGFPQIVSASHNPMQPCITCHNPHDPVPPETPKECAACHAEIARTKAVSHHVYIPCTRCHETPDEHKMDPRAVRPTIPMTREFCGGCHAEDAPSDKGIRRVDMVGHEPRYVCWQCHYPHLPEAR